jgi:hypothetical protein
MEKVIYQGRDIFHECACGETPTPTRILLPTVSITSPINGTLFTAGLIVPITAIASAPGGIVQVAFYSGSTLLENQSRNHAAS